MKPRTLIGALMVIGTAAAVAAVAGLSASHDDALPRRATDCRVDPATMLAPGCRLARSDTSVQADPNPGLWGSLSAVSAERHQEFTYGGDRRSQANGKPQRNAAFRRLTVEDGDDYFGERTELGRNEYRYGENSGTQTSGTFALYREGERRLTFFSQRYGAGFTASRDGWQTVMQMKQAQPYDGNGPVDGAPALELQIFGNKLRLRSFHRTNWATRAPPKGKWIRYALDVTYSQDPAIGTVQAFVDSNADGDFRDRGEISPALKQRTLAYVTSQDGARGALEEGASIPSHLRLGIYHHEDVYGTTVVGVDNIQILTPKFRQS
jgi:Polysaccharide lyase